MLHSKRGRLQSEALTGAAGLRPVLAVVALGDELRRDPNPP